MNDDDAMLKLCFALYVLQLGFPSHTVAPASRAIVHDGSTVLIPLFLRDIAFGDESILCFVATEMRVRFFIILVIFS